MEPSGVFVQILREMRNVVNPDSYFALLFMTSGSLVRRTGPVAVLHFSLTGLVLNSWKPTQAVPVK